MAQLRWNRRAAPLEGLPPDAILASVRAALSHNLIDDLDWLSPDAAAVALYELAAAIPTSVERQQLGRRVALRLREGDASTFVALATALALGSRRGLRGMDIRARLALSLELPIGTGTGADALALALISRRNLEREWLSTPSTGSLPSRRLAARLLERAARQAAQRASQGDEAALRVFDTPSVSAAWSRLLEDRESLVWRHVATARGLLSSALPTLESEIERGLVTTGNIGKWRRSAASLAASIAVRPDAALRRAHSLMKSDLLKRDPGIAAAMIFGLARAVEVEPEAAEELLGSLVEKADVYTAQALVDLKQELGTTNFGEKACLHTAARLQNLLENITASDDGNSALLRSLIMDLSVDRPGMSLNEQLLAALSAFADGGAGAAGQQAREVLETVKSTLDRLHAADESNMEGRQQSFITLHELDVAVLKRATLRDLLSLRVRGDGTVNESPLDPVIGKLATWLTEKEQEAQQQGAELKHPVLRQHRLVALLHLLDTDWGQGENRVDPREKRTRPGMERVNEARRQRLAATRLLMLRAKQDIPDSLRRVLFAGLARACDSLVRDELCETSDTLIAMATHVSTADGFKTLSEASMLQDVKAPVASYHELKHVLETARDGSAGSATTALHSLHKFADELQAGTPRVEALRSNLLELVGALETVSSTRSLSELAEGSEQVWVQRLENAVETLSRLTTGAKRRFGLEVDDEPPMSGSMVRMLEVAIQHALRGNRQELETALSSAVTTFHDELPPAIADVAAMVLVRIAGRPDRGPKKTLVNLPAINASNALPPWLPPGRTLGGYYVLRKLGTGGVASVFVARRAEERHNQSATQFALKVPEYSGTAARTLSEAEFYTMFREEAGALLSLPNHPNLANFVTFDAGVKPKPILVMELVEGSSLERVIEMGDVTTESAFKVLDGIASGLAAMHRVGVGHLDIKPSNVILRQPNDIRQSESDPVLVDFGLAGRRVRPGCATSQYGAPEVWGLAPEGDASPPQATDVYAFACVVFELLTTQTLFDAPSEVATISQHVTHDGAPNQIEHLAKNP